MTDSAMKAKKWLNRTIELQDRIKKLETEIRILENRINHPVSSYGFNGTGRTDPLTRQQQREDALLEYSEKKEQLDSASHELVKQELITIRVIDRLSNPLYAAILLDHYVNRYTWKKIINDNTYHYARSQLFRFNQKALDELGYLITSEEPQAIIEVEREIKDHQAS